ncbi:MAG: dephospho-CoA kinase [Oscillospiraceae bacterium]|nr:dephospho-CoA kinase [Oscillospiraceae bacterium]
MVIGLTGGTGCGKTTALRVLQEMGARCFDADAVYHELLRTDGALLAAIGAAFPGTVENGGLQRKKLGAQVFGDPEKLQLLSSITQPRVAEAIEKELDGSLAVIDAIALTESGLHKLCDHTVAVIAPREAQITRIMAREGISRSYAEARVDAQKSAEAFASSCEFVLKNEGTAEEFRETCRNLFEKLVKEKEI